MKSMNWAYRHRLQETSIPEKQMHRSLIICWKALDILEQYFNDTVAAGYAAQNQLYATLSSLTRKSAKTKAAAQAANEINRLKTPVYQADLATIESQFMLAVKEVKKEIGNDFAAIRAMTAEETERMFTEITKGQDMENLTVTPQQTSDMIVGSVAGMGCVDPDALNTFGEALTGLFQSILDNAASQEKDDEQTEQ
mgnify:CR=1 FL=1